jgi:hypothetical protein
MERLAEAVRSSVARMRELERELVEARAQMRSLEDQLRRFTSGEENPSELLTRLGRLEAENRVLVERLQKGRAGVERMLAQVRFLEEQT